jgi:hypothetical protein
MRVVAGTRELTLTSKAYVKFRLGMKAEWRAVNAPCSICHQRTIRWDGKPNEPDSFELHHTPIPHKRIRLTKQWHLLIDPKNAAPSHARCNRSLQAGAALPALGELSEDW